MRRLMRVGLALTASVAALAGCGGSHPSATSAPAAVTLEVSTHPRLGSFLVSGGRTLYMYPPDEQRSVTCTTTDDCMSAWPPLFVKPGTTPKAGPGIDPSLIGVISGDGGSIVTYNRWPLYYYLGDRHRGEVNGQDQGFNWFVIAPTGKPIRTGPVS